ncbi:SulP family inorganic anion transporter [Pseudodonghicola xiamenensis]|uniref:Sodium-independent anion transporter n=1 Tax=Pseudodonghicola xiamenensis TaxID=337702 RepID=A0A8J3H532_9RHOB|nr:sulfate permease [Pseudodonghicola xiamenensis]GHG81211.1 sodium-independent anion transporter [Pseudodonghicola xiamenensis]
MTTSSSRLARLTSYLPILDWGRRYGRADLTGDLIAAVIVTIMLIPQSLAYALLAGLPAEVGLYASILPLVFYAVFGTSRALAVGPVAVVSLMTASALAPLGLETIGDYTAAAAVLALVSGVILLAMGLLRLGVVANFLSHPVIAGFITASGILIAASQAKHILGIKAGGHTLPEILIEIGRQLPNVNWPTLVIGLIALAFLFWVRKGLAGVLKSAFGMSAQAASTTARVGPVFAVIGTTIAAWALELPGAGVAVVGQVPTGLPPLGLPTIDFGTLGALVVPAILISIIGYVESVSVAQTLAAKRKQRIEPNQELIALGAANISSGLSGGYPVTGGFARSVVNFDAGAETPAAGAFTAVGLLLAALLLTPLLFFLPKATLAATIIVAVLSLVDLSILTRAWGYSKADFAAVLVTILLTLGVGVEVGVAAGVLVSLALFVWKTSRPHVAEVGQVPGSQHFRNVLRHKVITDPAVLTLRIDESLYFANARRMEDLILARVHRNRDEIKHVILMCSAVNEVDLSALESLEAINQRLTDQGIELHLSEVKGPVMDRLKCSHFLDELSGQVFLSQYDAFVALIEREHAGGDKLSVA